jgi:hypothetical protein
MGLLHVLEGHLRMTPSQILSAAADLIEREGWIQNPDREGPPYCAMTAVWRANTSGLLPVFWDCGEALRTVLGTNSVSVWNDAPERTKAEVLAALRAAAK